MEDAFSKGGLFSEEKMNALIEIAGGILDTLVQENVGGEKSPPMPRLQAARNILNHASRHAAGTIIRIDGKELSPTKQRPLLNSISSKSKALSEDIRNIWGRDNWNFSSHLAKHGIRNEIERLIYLLGNTHRAAKAALQDLEPVKKKWELTNAQKTARTEFISALFKVWENIFEKPITLSRTSATKTSTGGRPSGPLVKFILKASEIANLKPALTREGAAYEIEKRRKQKK